MDDDEGKHYEESIFNKSWQKLTDTLFKAGFRDGAETGRERTLQSGFDEGYKEGFSAGYKIGCIKGLASVLKAKNGLSSTSDQLQFWKNPLQNLCELCETDKKDTPDYPLPDLSEIKSKQQLLISKKVEEEEENNAELFEKFGIAPK